MQHIGLERGESGVSGWWRRMRCKAATKAWRMLCKSTTAEGESSPATANCPQNIGSRVNTSFKRFDIRAF